MIVGVIVGMIVGMIVANSRAERHDRWVHGRCLCFERRAPHAYGQLLKQHSMEANARPTWNLISAINARVNRKARNAQQALWGAIGQVKENPQVKRGGESLERLFGEVKKGPREVVRGISEKILGASGRETRKTLTDAGASLLMLPAGAVAAERFVRFIARVNPREERKLSPAQLSGIGLLVHYIPKIIHADATASLLPSGDKAASLAAPLLRAIPEPDRAQALEASVWTFVISDMYGSAVENPSVIASALLGFYTVPLVAKWLRLLHNMGIEHIEHLTDGAQPTTTDAEPNRERRNNQSRDLKDAFMVLALFELIASAALFWTSSLLPATFTRVDSTPFVVLSTLLLRLLNAFPVSLSPAVDLKQIFKDHITPALGTVAAGILSKEIGKGLPGEGGRQTKTALFVALESSFGRIIAEKLGEKALRVANDATSEATTSQSASPSQPNEQSDKRSNA